MYQDILPGLLNNAFSNFKNLVKQKNFPGCYRQISDCKDKLAAQITMTRQEFQLIYPTDKNLRSIYDSVNAKRYNEALAALDKARQESPQNRNLAEWLGCIYALSGKYSDAITLLSQLNTKEQTFRTSFNLAVVHAMQGAADQALETIKDMVATKFFGRKSICFGLVLALETNDQKFLLNYLSSFLDIDKLALGLILANECGNTTDVDDYGNKLYSILFDDDFMKIARDTNPKNPLDTAKAFIARKFVKAGLLKIKTLINDSTINGYYLAAQADLFWENGQKSEAIQSYKQEIDYWQKKQLFPQLRERLTKVLNLYENYVDDDNVYFLELARKHKLSTAQITRIANITTQEATPAATAPRPSKPRIDILDKSKVEVRIANEFLPDIVMEPSLIIEIFNPLQQTIVAGSVTLNCIGDGYEVVKPTISIETSVLPKKSTTLHFQLKRKTRVLQQQFSIKIVYKVDSVSTPYFHIYPFTLPVEPFTNKVSSGSITAEYIAGKKIVFDKPNHFHGREDVLSKIRNSVAGAEQRSALFLSGLRRIGKSSVLEFLNGSPPENTMPILTSWDNYSPNTNVDFIYCLCDEIYRSLAKRQNTTVLHHPSKSEIADDIPGTFQRFIDQAQAILGDKKLLLMMDEFQVITERIKRHFDQPDEDSWINTATLDLLRAGVDAGDFLIIFTGSILYQEIKEHTKSPHRNYDRLWGLVESEDVSFISKQAVEQTLKKPMPIIQYTAAAVDRVWDYTAGYPIFVQLIGQKLVPILNAEKRLVVSTQDVDKVAEDIVHSSDWFNYWWDPKRLKTLDFSIVNHIINNQTGLGIGVSKDQLNEQRLSGSNQAYLNHALDHLQRLHILSIEDDNYIRIKGLLLEKWLFYQSKLNAGKLPYQPDNPPQESQKKVGIFIDHENVCKGLEHLEEYSNIPPDKLIIEYVQKRLYEKAQSLGQVKSAFAFAAWNSTEYQNHGSYYQPAFSLEQPVNPFKADTTDHALIVRVYAEDKKHDLNTIIIVSGDGDYAGLVMDMLRSQKQVHIWSTRERMSQIYKRLPGNDINVEAIEFILET